MFYAQGDKSLDWVLRAHAVGVAEATAQAASYNLVNIRLLNYAVALRPNCTSRAREGFCGTQGVNY